MWWAFVDESEARVTEAGTTTAVYILAATLVEHAMLDEVRAETLALRRPGQRKTHWRDESAASRLALAKLVSEMPVLHLVVARRSSLGEHAERRRRKCLEGLVHELGTWPTHTIVLEARESSSNTKELRFFDRLRSTALIVPPLIRHTPGAHDPLLGIPDIVAGASNANVRGNGRYLDVLNKATEVIRIR